MRVAIIGAGISGSAFALWLVQERRRRGQAIDVVLFDKGRRPGGRASSQPSPRDAQWESDFGAISVMFNPYTQWLPTHSAAHVTATERVQRQLLTWIESGALISVRPNIKDEHHPLSQHQGRDLANRP